jgi:hypothetical protein
MDTGPVASALEEAAKQVATLKGLDGAAALVAAQEKAIAASASQHREAMAQRAEHHAALMALFKSNHAQTAVVLGELKQMLQANTRAVERARALAIVMDLREQNITYGNQEKKLNLILGAQQLGCNVLVPDQQDRRINYDSELTNAARQALTFLQTVAHRFG